MARKRNSRKKARGVGRPISINLEDSFREAFDLGTVRLLEAAPDKPMRVVVIRAGFSKNKDRRGRQLFYPESTLKTATPLFEGMRVNAFKFGGQFDHLPHRAKEAVPGGFVRNVIGFLKDCEFGPIPDEPGEFGIMASFVPTETDAAKDAVHVLRTAHAENAQGPGFSIDATGNARNTTISGTKAKQITAIESVDSLDLVSQPAAGGRLLRLVASHNGATMLRVLTFLQEHFPGWVDGIDAEQVAESKVGDLVAQVLGNVRESGLAAMAAAESGSEDFTENAALVAALQGVLEALAAGEVEAAMEVLAAMIAQADPEEDQEEPAAEPEPEPAAEAKDDEDDDRPKKKDEKEQHQMSEVTESRIEKLEQELAESRARARITEALADSGLPSHSAARIRVAFEGKTEIDGDKLTQLINDEKDHLAKLSESGNVKGCGKGRHSVEVGEEQKDRWHKAMYAMMTGKPSVDGVKAFTGLHESHRIIDGRSMSKAERSDSIMQSMVFALPGRPTDDEGFAEHHNRLRESVSLRESLTTATWAEAFGDSVTRALISAYNGTELPNFREVVSDLRTVDDFRTQRRIRVGGFADLDTVGELGTYPAFSDPGDEEVTYAVSKKGNLWPVSMEAIRNDDLGAINPARMGVAAMRTLSKFVLKDLISDNPLVYDGTALIAAGHSNDQTAALTEATLQIAIQQMRKQTEFSSGERLGLMPKILMVPPDLEDTAWELTMSERKPNTSEDSTLPNITKSKYGVMPLTNIWQTDTNDWFLISDPLLNPTVELGFLDSQEPAIFVQDQPEVGSVFTADKITWKVRHIYSGAVLDYRTFAGSIVA